MDSTSAWKAGDPWFDDSRLRYDQFCAAVSTLYIYRDILNIQFSCILHVVTKRVNIKA